MEAKTPTKEEQILNTVAGEDTNLAVWVMSGGLQDKLLSLIASGIESADQEKRLHAIEFIEWMQRYALYDYSKKPYRYAGRQQPQMGRHKPETWTASELYNLFISEQLKQQL